MQIKIKGCSEKVRRTYSCTYLLDGSGWRLVIVAEFNWHCEQLEEMKWSVLWKLSNHKSKCGRKWWAVSRADSKMFTLSIFIVLYIILYYGIVYTVLSLSIQLQYNGHRAWAAKYDSKWYSVNSSYLYRSEAKPIAFEFDKRNEKRLICGWSFFAYKIFCFIIYVFRI